MSVFSIEDETLENVAYMRVVHTDHLQQIVVMSLKPREETGTTVHDVTSQFICVEQGEGTAFLDGVEYGICEGEVLVIPAGTEYTIVAAGKEPLKLYTVYSGEPLYAPGEVRTRKK